MAVQVIRATKQNTGIAAAAGETERIRVAAYCRVSTDSDEQETSYEAQCRHYTEFIENEQDWELAGIYADEGISGTSVKKREQFNQMIRDCEAGLIDMVITKSISRWARNTIDSLQNIRKLRALGIPVLFEKENINTLDAKGEVLITIMSSIAQQESDSISRNVRIGIQYQFQQGRGRLNTAQFLGYEKGASGELVIVPEEAEVVRRIYREYLEGYSPGMIAARLTAGGIPTPAGKPKWHQSTVVSILENEKYCGDLLMQKYYVENFLTHRIVRNTGQLPQYYVENAHPPIVPREVYNQVQGEIYRRSLLRQDPTKLRYGSSMALSGRLVCGRCGRVLKRYRNPDPERTDWRCRKRAYNKKTVDVEVQPMCPCRNVPEKEAERAIMEAFRRLPERRVELIRIQAELRDEIEELVKGQTEFRAELDKKLDGLELKKAEAANKEVKIRIALELIDVMKGDTDESDAMTGLGDSDDLETVGAIVGAGYGDGDNDDAEDGGFAACCGYEEFFRRTRCILSGSAVFKFSNDTVIRYLDKVIIHDDSYEVVFKCGITETVYVKPLIC